MKLAGLLLILIAAISPAQRPIPNAHREQVLQTFPILKKAEPMPGCGMGESYHFRFKTRSGYDEFKRQLAKLGWKRERGTLAGVPMVISHSWHRDKHRAHVWINVNED